MSRRMKGHKSFLRGKDKKGEDCHTSFFGPPNTNLDTYRKEDGRFIKRRKFGKDGYAVKDYDVADSHKRYDHVHDISRISGRNPEDRDPNKQEKREINKAKRKRRFLE